MWESKRELRVRLAAAEQHIGQLLAHIATTTSHTATFGDELVKVMVEERRLSDERWAKLTTDLNTPPAYDAAGYATPPPNGLVPGDSNYRTIMPDSPEGPVPWYLVDRDAVGIDPTDSDPALAEPFPTTNAERTGMVAPGEDFLSMIRQQPASGLQGMGGAPDLSGEMYGERGNVDSE